MVTNQNQLSNGLPVYTGNQSISASYNLLHRFTCGFFLKNKNGHKLLWFHRGAQQWKPAASRRSERLKPSSSTICCRSPQGEERCWFWHSLPVPTNKSWLFFFSQTCWLRISLENGGRRRGKKRKGGGRKQPPGWRKILYVCALKHKVCGQLLKDFSGELRLSTESIE